MNQSIDWTEEVRARVVSYTKRFFVGGTLWLANFIADLAAAYPKKKEEEEESE